MVKDITTVIDITGILRIIQSIPSHKAEPFKIWLAEVGKERIEETIDPELAIDRALETFNSPEFEGIKNQAGTNRFLLSVKQWIEKTNAKGIVADVLNVALFGITAKEWREHNTDKEGNIRDYASMEELICLSNFV